MSTTCSANLHPGQSNTSPSTTSEHAVQFVHTSLFAAGAPCFLFFLLNRPMITSLRLSKRCLLVPSEFCLDRNDLFSLDASHILAQASRVCR